MPRPCARWPFLAAVLLTAVARAAPDVPLKTEADPMRAPVPRRPAVRSPLKGDDYAERYAAAVRDLGPPPAADAPTAGLRLLVVDADGLAGKAGLRVGDVVTTVDGRPVGDVADFERLRATAAGPQAWGVTTDDKARSVTVPPGDLGVRATEVWLLEAQYLHDLPAGVAPLEAVRVACRAAASDPPLAESALAQVAPGPAAPAATVDVIMAAVATAGGRYDPALAYAMDARPTLPADERRRLDALAARLALATFRWPLAEQLGVTDPYVLALADRYEARPHAVAEPVPFGAADALGFVDQTKGLTNVASKENGERASSRDFLKAVKQDNAADVTEDDGDYVIAQCGPAGADVDVSMRCRYRPSPDRHSGYARCLVVGLRTDDGRPAVELTLYADGQATVGLDGHEVVALDLAWPTRDGRAFDVRATVVGDRCGIEVGGHHVYYGPVPSAMADEAGRKLTLSVQAVGLHGELRAFHWRTRPLRQP